MPSGGSKKMRKNWNWKHQLLVYVEDVDILGETYIS